MSRRRFTEKERKEIAQKTDDLLNVGYTRVEIAKRLGVKYGTLSNFHFRYKGYHKKKEPPSLPSLRRRALLITSVRGHRIKWDEDADSPGVINYGICSRCGLMVTVNTMPPADGRNVSGEALTLLCSREGGRDDIP